MCICLCNRSNYVKREIMAQLRGWAGSKQRKPLVLRGARQVGKTTLLEEFGKEFDSFISLNLEKDDAEVFRRFKTAPEVWQYVCLKHHITLRPFSFVEYLEAKGYDDWAESVRGLNAHTLLHPGPAYSRP